MAQPPPPAFATRAFTPVRNPVYAQLADDSFKSPQPRHVLDQPQTKTDEADRRLTAYGSRPPVAGLTPIVPMAGQTPYNVWALYPA